MNFLEPTFNPEPYIEGVLVFNEVIEGTNLPNIIGQMRALLTIALKNHPEQVLIHFSKQSASATRCTIRLMSSHTRGIDLHHRHNQWRF